MYYEKIKNKDLNKKSIEDLIKYITKKFKILSNLKVDHTKPSTNITPSVNLQEQAINEYARHIRGNDKSIIVFAAAFEDIEKDKLSKIFKISLKLLDDNKVIIEKYREGFIKNYIINKNIDEAIMAAIKAGSKVIEELRKSAPPGLPALPAPPVLPALPAPPGQPVPNNNILNSRNRTPTIPSLLKQEMDNKINSLLLNYQSTLKLQERGNSFKDF